MKKNLSRVTICAVDTLNARLASFALEKSCSECDFGDAILFTDKFNECPKTHKTQLINTIKNRDEYSYFVLKELGKYIQTEYVLIVQWDGFVVNGSKWTDDFYDYDYIGATWHWYGDDFKVGNGGFSLRSKNLLDILSNEDFPFINGTNEDIQICRNYRKKLEDKYDLMFASESIAQIFSYERTPPENLTFGFHGLFNVWRHLSDDELLYLLNNLNQNNILTIEYFELMIQYYSLKKFKPLKHLFAKADQFFTKDELKNFLNKISHNRDFNNDFIKICENL